MRPYYSLVLMLLAGPVAAQSRPQTPAELESAEYLATRDARPHLYLGAAVAVPVYWREPTFRNRPAGWGLLTAFAGYKLNTHWAAQVGFNRGSFATAYDVYQPVPGPLGYQVVGTGHASGAYTSVPVLVRYQQRRKPYGVTLEGSAGLVPQWQRFATNEVAALPGQPAFETNILANTTNVYATTGLAGVFDLGAASDLLLEAALNRRVFSSGTASAAPAFVPTFGLGFRYRFGILPRRGSYLAE